MAYSINFDGNDLSDYSLVVTSPGVNEFRQSVGRVQLQDRGYAFKPNREPRSIIVAFDVSGTSRSNLDSNLDTIKRILNQIIVKQLKFDVLSGRYFNAILETFEGNYLQATLFRGTMEFICPDPVAYDNTETISSFNIDADPKTVTEAVGGNAYILPVFTLTAGDTLTTVTILVDNLTTLEQLSWIGSLAIGEELVIDSERWLVTKEGTADMGEVTGEFPRLEPNVTNSIKVTAFGTNGTMSITYRKGYL